MLAISEVKITKIVAFGFDFHDFKRKFIRVDVDRTSLYPIRDRGSWNETVRRSFMEAPPEGSRPASAV